MLGRMPTTAKIYMAGPLGFSEAGRHFYNSVFVPFVAGLGYEVLHPWTLTDPHKIEAVKPPPYGSERSGARRKLNREMRATNRAGIGAAHGAVAMLAGPDAETRT